MPRQGGAPNPLGQELDGTAIIPPRPVDRTQQSAFREGRDARGIPRAAATSAADIRSSTSRDGTELRRSIVAPTTAAPDIQSPR